MHKISAYSTIAKESTIVTRYIKKPTEIHNYKQSYNNNINEDH